MRAAGRPWRGLPRRRRGSPQHGPERLGNLHCLEAGFEEGNFQIEPRTQKFGASLVLSFKAFADEFAGSRVAELHPPLLPALEF